MTNDIAKRDDSLPSATTDAAAIMQIIERVAMNPAADMDKLERLLLMQERIRDWNAEQAFNASMNAAQEAMRPIAADANNPQTKSKYASYAALDRAVRPLYTKEGFSLSFDTADGAPPDHVRVVCRIGHEAGHKETRHLDMPADGKGAKGGDVMTKTHAIGAAITYGKRYLLGMIFNIAVGEDDDGNSNGGRGQSAAVEAAITAINLCNGAAELALWKKNNADGLNALPSDEADAIVRHYNMRVKKAKEQG